MYSSLSKAQSAFSVRNDPKRQTSLKLLKWFVNVNFFLKEVDREIDFPGSAGSLVLICRLICRICICRICNFSERIVVCSQYAKYANNMQNRQICGAGDRPSLTYFNMKICATNFADAYYYMSHYILQWSILLISGILTTWLRLTCTSIYSFIGGQAGVGEGLGFRV